MCDNAIAACNQAKLTYDHDVYIYDDALMSKNQQNIQITKTMKQSLMNEDFKVYYQPKYDIQTNQDDWSRGTYKMATSGIRIYFAG